MSAATIRSGRAIDLLLVLPSPNTLACQHPVEEVFPAHRETVSVDAAMPPIKVVWLFVRFFPPLPLLAVVTPTMGSVALRRRHEAARGGTWDTGYAAAKRLPPYIP